MGDSLADTVTDDQIRALRQREAQWLHSIHLNPKGTNYDEYQEHSMAHYHACVALGIRRARRGGSRAKSRARCAEILWGQSS